MGSFQVFRAGAEAFAETQLGMKAATTISDAATSASKFLSEAYPSCKGILSKATDLFRIPQTASSLGLEAKGAAEMTATERAATRGGQTYEEMLAAYQRERANGFAGTRELINQTRAVETNGFNAFSRQVEKIQGIVSPVAESTGTELPRSLEGVRKSFQPVTTALDIGSARSANLHNFVPGESSNLATRIQPSSLRYPPLESVKGTTAARAEQATAAVDEAGAGIGSESAETTTVAKGSKRVRRTKVASESEASSGESAEAKPRARRSSRKASESEVAGEPPELQTARTERPAKVEAPKEPVKAEAPKEPVKAEEPATAEEAVEGEVTESAGPKLNRAARRRLASNKVDRRLARSVKEEEAMAAQRA